MRGERADGTRYAGIIGGYMYANEKKRDVGIRELLHVQCDQDFCVAYCSNVDLLSGPGASQGVWLGKEAGLQDNAIELLLC